MAVQWTAAGQGYLSTQGMTGGFNQYTWTCWIRLDSTPSSFTNVVWFESGSRQYVITDGVNIRFQSQGGSTIGQVALTVGVWTPIAVTVNNGTATFYRATSGDVGGLTSASGSCSNTADHTDLGLGRTSINSDWFPGRMASFKLWKNTVLNASQIAAELSQHEPLITAGLDRFYRFATASGVDSGPNGYNLTGSGGSTATDPDIPESGTDELGISDTFSLAASVAAQDALGIVDALAVADAVTVVDAENVPVADAISAADTVGIFDITTELTPLVDTATVGEAVTTADSLAAADAAAATDSVAFTDSLNPGDSLSAADAVTIQDTQFLTPTDTASTDTALDILDVPSAMLGAVDYGPTYDLVVVAAIPRQSGPPAFQELDPIEWDSLKWADILSAPQELSATAPLTRLPPTVLQRLERPHAHPTELWLWRDGRLVAAGPLVGWTKDSDTVTVKAAGILAYCDAMFVQNDLRFDQVDQFTIARNLIDQWQTSDYGHCGIDTSAVGESGVLRDATYARTEIHRVGQRVNELGRRRDGFDAEVDPVTRRLQLWHPGKGVNRSQGEDAIVIDERSITSGQVACSVSPGDLATEGFGAGSAAGAASALWSHQSNADLRATYGRRGVAGTWSDVSEQATLDAHVQGMLDARSEALLIPGPGLRVTPDADLAAYEVGDTILYDESHALLGVTGAFRIRKREVSVAENGMQETVAVEFV